MLVKELRDTGDIDCMMLSVNNYVFEIVKFVVVVSWAKKNLATRRFNIIYEYLVF